MKVHGNRTMRKRLFVQRSPLLGASRASCRVTLVPHSTVKACSLSSSASFAPFCVATERAGLFRSNRTSLADAVSFGRRSYCSLPQESPAEEPATQDTEKPKKVVDWASTKVTRRPRGWWQDINNQRAYLDNLGKELGIKQLADWYPISKYDLLERGGKGLLTQYPSLGYALKSVYPHFPWQIPRFIDSHKRPSKWAY